MRKRNAMRATYVGLMLAAAAWAQVGAPSLGFLPNGGFILPVRGIAASASVAAPLNFGREFLKTAISPRQDFALVSETGSGAVLVANPDATTTAVADTEKFPSSIVFSPSGSAAVLWFGSSNMMQILSGLPSAPAVRTVNVSFMGSAGEQPAVLSVSDDGAWSAGAWPSGVWAFGPNGEPRSVLPGRLGLALTFVPARQDLLAGVAGEIDSIKDVGGSAAVSTVYSAGGLAPVGLGVSADGSRIVMADGTGITTIDTASGAAARIDCGCAPEGLFGMGPNLFRITGLTGSVFRVFDTRSASVLQIPLTAGVLASPRTVPVLSQPSPPRLKPVAGGGLR